MVKPSEKVKHLDVLGEYYDRLRAAFSQVPFLSFLHEVADCPSVDANLIVRIRVAAQTWTLVCQGQQYSELRHVKAAILQLHRSVQAMGRKNAYGVLVAPYISSEAANLLRHEGMGFVDFAGNCLLSFDTVHIQHSGAPNPFAANRRQRSLFASKSARVLHVLLRTPLRAWKGTELAAAAHVSGGQVSKVRAGLLEREWAVEEANGLRICRPDALLDAWRAAYEKRVIESRCFYTALHGKALEDAIFAAFEAAGQDARMVLASYSAARWMAPYVRIATNFFYADHAAISILHEHLQLRPMPRGENIVIDIPRDEGVFMEKMESAPNLWTTSLVQTYLDLAVSGERGAEGAEHLRATKIAPAWSTHE